MNKKAQLRCTIAHDGNSISPAKLLEKANAANIADVSCKSIDHSSPLILPSRGGFISFGYHNRITYSERY